MGHQLDQGHGLAMGNPSLFRQIDLMKGISVLLIVTFHFGGQIFKVNPDSAYRILTYQGVQVFFILSGFGLLHAHLHRIRTGAVFSWQQWFIRRFIRIYPLYILVLGFTLAVSLSGAKVIKVSNVSGNVIADFFLHATMLHIFSLRTFWSMNVALWFVGVITFLYLLFPFLSWALSRWNRPVLLWCIAVFVYFLSITVKTAAVGPFDFRNPAFSDIMLSQMITGLLLFFDGMVLARLWFDGRLAYAAPTGTIIFFVSFFAVIVILRIIAGRPGDNIYYALWHLLTVSVFLFLSTGTHALLAGARHSLPARLFAGALIWVGSCSYAVYLIHWGFISPIMSRFSSFVSGLAVYVVVITALAYLLTKGNDRAKESLTRLLIRTGARTKDSSTAKGVI